MRFAEQMHGYVAFGERDYNAGWRVGRRDGIRCSVHLDMPVPGNPSEPVRPSGEVRCGGLGGSLEVVDGEVRLLEPTGERRRRFLYWLHLRDGEGRPLTFAGFKSVEDDPNLDVRSDTTVLFTRVAAGHHAVDAEIPDAAVLARGILKVRHVDAARLLASFRGSPGDLVRFARFFGGRLADVYSGPEVEAAGTPSFPGSDPFAGYEPGVWHRPPERPDLERRILEVRAEDGRLLTLHHLRGDRAPDRGPVYLSHAAASRVNSFYAAPRRPTLADALLDAGYDIYLGNWRGSIDLPPHDWTLDHVAAYDHPALVARVREESGAPRFGAVVHCLGSASFCLSAAAGLVPEVDTVVASAVAFHFQVRPTALLKQRAMLPLAWTFLPGVDSQWGVRAPSAVAAGFARFTSLIRRECPDPVCAMTQYCYGTGPDVVWRHAELDQPTHEWLLREFGYTPFSLFRQVRGACAEGHVRPTGICDRLPEDVTAAAPQTDARFTLFTGADNRLFAPAGMRRSHRWLDGVDPGRHRHAELPGFGHIDLYVGRRAASEVHPVVLAGLDRAGRLAAI